MKASPQQVLERRLRRLLACYPAQYRAANASEMLGVALARAADGQRWPGVGEAASLVWSGLGKRLEFTVLRNERGDGAWRDAAVVLTVLGPIVLAASAVRAIPFGGHISWPAAGATAGWIVLAVLAWLGWRRITAIGALAGLAGSVVQYSVPGANGHARGWWTVILATAIAVAGLVSAGQASAGQASAGQASAGQASAGARPGRVLSGRATFVAAAAAAVPATSGAVLAALAAWRIGADHVPFTWSTPGVDTKLVDVIVTVLGGLVLTGVTFRLRGAVRRRIAVMLFPVLVTFLLSSGSLYGVVVTRLWFLEPQPPLPVMPPSPAMIVVPLVCFAAGLIVLARHERMLRRVAQEGVVT